MSPRGHRAPAADVAAAARDYLDGASSRQVTATYGIGSGTLRAAVAAAGGRMRPKNPPADPDRLATAARLYAQGASLDEVAARLRMGQGTVLAALSAHGIPTRPSGCAHRRRFTTAEAAELARRHEAGESFKALAREHGVSDKAVARAIARLREEQR